MCGVFERCKQGSYDEQGGAFNRHRYFDTPAFNRPLDTSTQAALCIRVAYAFDTPLLVCGVLVCGVRTTGPHSWSVCGVRCAHPGRGLLAHTHSTRAHLVNAYDRAPLSLARCFGRPANAYDRGLGAQLKLTRVRRLCKDRRPVGLLHKPFRRLARVFDTPCGRGRG